MDLERDLRFLSFLPEDRVGNVLKLIPESRSQLRQDLFVLSVLGFEKSRYFVEFGATDGVGLSNTYLLEKRLGWSGILAEPAKMWHASLRENRSAAIDLRCVWKSSSETLKFVEAGELSTISRFKESDQHSVAREGASSYFVETVSLHDLLKAHNAPPVIDYLSIDTEGSEFDVLESFDFTSRQIRVITCEHNYTKNREKIRQLLEKNGFHRVLTEVSEWDDWYVHKSVIEEGELPK